LQAQSASFGRGCVKRTNPALLIWLEFAGREEAGRAQPRCKSPWRDVSHPNLGLGAGLGDAVIDDATLRRHFSAAISTRPAAAAAAYPGSSNPVERAEGTGRDARKIARQQDKRREIATSEVSPSYIDDGNAFDGQVQCKSIPNTCSSTIPSRCRIRLLH